ncbi:arginine--tRNA ligase [Chloracidobacterium validum]|uniref:arginine--tRNA ligase n=1 Tax=Chloracidobacterium validum TaxID=2821543 RepID=A0ABX8B7H2_9BACT|nr:arginine--tRNA ligase [Chloracidobacterium validum]QUW02629.1 arginine--tRNA ligase [Chloracidobacterium validum]
MFYQLRETVRQTVKALVERRFGLALADVAVEFPPNVSLGDLATPVAFEVAKRLKAATGEKHAPRDIAQALATELGSELSVFERIEVAGAGYVNLFLNRADAFLNALEAPAARLAPRFGGKLIVEHTSVNPNKAAHIGHLRNAVLGDALVRLLRATGETVEIHNYIDDTGVQVADVVVGFKHIEGKSLDEVAAIDGKFDDYCWDLYARVGAWYAADETRLRLRAETLHAIERHEGETAALAAHVAERIVRCHLITMERLGIQYDVLPCESAVLRLDFWADAFERLQSSGAIVYEAEGRRAGCWVMRAEQGATAAPDDEHDADKILVRSNGTVNYTGKDIAYHLWKLGVLDRDFHYRAFYGYPDGHTVWMGSATPPAAQPSPPSFGRGVAYLNVIDVGQSYAQEFVKRGVLAVAPDDVRDRVAASAHVAYEKVALTPASCLELGFTLSEEDRRRPFVSMSGRKGLGVKADELLDRLESKALAHVQASQPDLPEAEQRTIAHQVAVAAVRYFLLKFARTTLIAFDFADALAEQGETGVYLLYSLVRMASIRRKLREAGLDCPAPAGILRDHLPRLATWLQDEGNRANEFWALTVTLLRYDTVLDEARESLEPAVVAKYAFQLAQMFSTFYNRHNIRHESDDVRRTFLIALVGLVENRLRASLAVLGIEAPERM